VSVTAMLLIIGVIAELDWRLWEMLTAAHGRPLKIEMRYGG